jgi:hypothetical protein
MEKLSNVVYATGRLSEQLLRVQQKYQPQIKYTKKSKKIWLEAYLAVIYSLWINFLTAGNFYA